MMYVTRCRLNGSSNKETKRNWLGQLLQHEPLDAAFEDEHVFHETLEHETDENARFRFLT